MGFWDFIAPDLESFREVLRPTMNPSAQVGDRLVPADQLIDAAWSAPGSAFGLAARLYYELNKTGGHPPSVGDLANNALQQQGSTALQGGLWTVGGPVAGVVVANAYRCTIEMSAGGRTISNVVCVLGTASGQEAAAAAAVLAAWKTASGPLANLSSAVTMVGVTAVDLSSSAGGIAIVADSTAGTLASTSGFATRAASALIRWNTATRSRSARGRLYHGPIREADINTDGATLDSTRATALATAYVNFRSSLSSASFPLQVLSVKNAAVTAVSSQVVDTQIATQRRRIRS